MNESTFHFLFNARRFSVSATSFAAASKRAKIALREKGNQLPQGDWKAENEPNTFYWSR